VIPEESGGEVAKNEKTNDGRMDDHRMICLEEGIIMTSTMFFSGRA
jgi:hypothetical protein